MKRGHYRLMPLIILIGFISVGLAGYYTYPIFDSAVVFWAVFTGIISFIGLVLGLKIVQLYSFAYKDALTCMFNRRFFYKVIEREIVSAEKKDRILTLALIDVDNFKRINDMYGHICGDTVLRELASVIRKNIRGCDCAARWGGEEFAIILPKTSPSGALKLAERIRSTVENHNFETDAAVIKVTISIGTASVKNAANSDSLVKSADRALYKAKEKKNRVMQAVS